jgi:ribose transport system permease protein
MSPKFYEATNLTNIVVQASSTAIVAIGMTFVLLTAGVDLSVGAAMYVGAGLAGKHVLGGGSFGEALLILAAAGLVFGLGNALLVTRLGIAPFVATLGTLYIGRGFGLWITETRAMNLPESFLHVGTQRWMGVPLPVWVFAFVLVLAHVVLTRTAFGRGLYAVGHNPEAARRAGLNVPLLIGSVYVISGFGAAIGAVLSLGQLGAVSPTFGLNREFAAIAAAVLGGTSLFGGRGGVFPGTVIGALLIQSVENGLVIVNADPYLYPLITSGIIFIAVAMDCLRQRQLERMGRRTIRVEEASG